MSTDGDQLKGLRRFHKVTIGAGILFLLLLSWRFLAHWRLQGGVRGLFGFAALAAATLLALYWWRFNRKGL